MMTWESMEKTKPNSLTGKTNDNKLSLFCASGLFGILFLINGSCEARRAIFSLPAHK